MRTGTIQGGPRLAALLNGKPVDTLERFTERLDNSHVFGAVVLIGGALLLMFGLPIVAAVLGVK